MSFVVAPTSAKAASYAVTHWHYSRSLPVGRLVKLGVWEDEHFTGVVIFSRGSNKDLGTRYGLTQTQLCELTRVALRIHQAPVSQIVAECLCYLKRSNPGLRLVISFADPGQGHHGGIYQAGNWIYTGTSDPERRYRIYGRLVHGRAVSPTQHGIPVGMHRSLAWICANLDPNAEAVTVRGKHRYLYPLDRAMRRQIAPLARPYPAAEASMVTRPATGGERQVRALPAALTSQDAL